MKKIITIGALFGSFFVFLLSVDAPMSLLRFVMVGELPGGFTLSADIMLATTGILIVSSFVYSALRFLPQTKIQSTVSRHMPRRRYTTIQ
jgi:hypothetical protein